MLRREVRSPTSEVRSPSAARAYWLTIACVFTIAAGSVGFGPQAGIAGSADQRASPKRPQLESEGWAMFRGSAALTGAAGTTLPQPLALRWKFHAKDAVGSSAAIVDGTVYVGSMDGVLHAIDVATGKERWQYQAAGPIEESSPGVGGGLVFVGDTSGVVHAVDAQTGRARWTFKTEAEVRSSPNPVGDKVYIGSYDEHLYCLQAATGRVIWKFHTDGPVHGTPSFDGGVIYISGCDEYLRAIDATSGRQRFAVPLGSNAGASAAVQAGTAYVGTMGNEVLAINLTRHSVQWTYRHPTRSFPFYSSAAIAPDRIVVGGRDKMVHCLLRSTGRTAWTFLTRARVESSPLIAGNRVFVGSNDGTLYELDLTTGKKAWEFTAGAAIPASPAAAEGVLVIGAEDGAVYCFGDARR